MSSNKNSFESKLIQFKKLMKFAAWRYSIPGVLDQADMYQEALLILNSAFERYSHKSDEEFRKLFKTELWHRLSNVLRKHKKSKRDYRVAFSLDSDAAAAKEVESVDLLEALQHARSPELELLLEQEQRAVNDLIDKLRSTLDEDDDSLDVFDELLDPTPWSEIPDVFKTPLDGLGYMNYERVPRNIPRHVVADMLGMSLSRVRKIKRHLARLTVSIAKEDELLPKLANQLK